jgi:hypothetical protein
MFPFDDARYGVPHKIYAPQAFTVLLGHTIGLGEDRVKGVKYRLVAANPEGNNARIVNWEDDKTKAVVSEGEVDIVFSVAKQKYHMSFNRRALDAVSWPIKDTFISSTNGTLRKLGTVFNTPLEAREEVKAKFEDGATVAPVFFLMDASTINIKYVGPLKQATCPWHVAAEPSCHAHRQRECRC